MTRRERNREGYSQAEIKHYPRKKTGLRQCVPRPRVVVQYPEEVRACPIQFRSFPTLLSVKTSAHFGSRTTHMTSATIRRFAEQRRCLHSCSVGIYPWRHVIQQHSNQKTCTNSNECIPPLAARSDSFACRRGVGFEAIWHSRGEGVYSFLAQQGVASGRDANARFTCFCSG